MQSITFHRVVATSLVAVCVEFSGCGGAASPDASSSTLAASQRTPSGAYQSRMPDGTVIKLTFRGEPSVTIAMTENGKTDSHEGKWVRNGEVILVEGDEGLTLQLSWRGDALVSDFGGLTMTFEKT